MNQKTGMLIRCCMCVGGAMGIVSNCMGIFFTPLSQSIGTSVGKISLMITLTSLTAAFSAPVFIRLNKTVRIHYLMSFGVLLAVLSFLTLSTANHLWVIYLCGILSGISMCCFAALPVSLVLRSWYGEKNGTALGTALAFSGVFGAIMNPVISRLITAFSYQTAMRIIALFLLVAVFPCAFTIRLREGGDPVQPQPVSKSTAKEPIRIAKPVLVVLFATCMGYCFLCGLNQHFSALAVSYGSTLEASATVMTFVMTGNICFKLLYGWLSDRINPITAAEIWLVIGMAGTALVALFGSDAVLIRIGAFFYATFFSLSTIALSMITQFIAKDQFPAVYARLNVFTSSTYALSVMIIGFIYDLTQSYRPAVFTVIAVSAFSLFGSFILYRKTTGAAKLKPAHHS